MPSKTMEPDFKSQLLAEMGRTNMEIVIAAIGERSDYFDRIVDMVLHGDHPLPMRAAWVMTICLEKHPEWIRPHCSRLIRQLPAYVHPGTRRSVLRSLSDPAIEIPKKDEGFLASLCFDWLAVPTSPIAVQVYCMEILFRLSHRYPEIRQELSEIIQSILPEASAGVRSRGKKILARLKKTGQES